MSCDICTNNPGELCMPGNALCKAHGCQIDRPMSNQKAQELLKTGKDIARVLAQERPKPGQKKPLGKLSLGSYKKR